ncbi:TorD/DmsD family molecular chaperone [Arsenophonus nasoniae]|uniref:Molecular chaperone n=1 Tax=Arsenophonus nasoniae TaxID=638 RepID=A0AA95K6F7_9GAMM|nr:molecular chaperone [Arsenophonus nasoniae]WGL94158.1 molecular chaperone [Arsenophonus nasoniae]
MNEFSVICRILGTLFNRSPEDPVTKPLFELIMQDQLKLSWPLEQDELLTQLAASSQDLALVIKDFKQLFLDPTSAIADSISQYSEISATAVNEFLLANAIPLSAEKADRFAAFLLAASWLEDNAVRDPLLTQIQLFDQFILPASELFFSQVETHAVSNFYPTLVMITREALVALREELAEN